MKTQGQVTVSRLSRLYPLLFTAVFTGMRASELRGLIWANVDLEHRVIYVRQRADGYRTIGPCKSASGSRAVPITDALLEVLREWKPRCPSSPLDLVFPGFRRRVEAHSNLHKTWGHLLRRLGMVDADGKPKYHFHSLRHFFVSLMIEQGMAPKRLQEIIGHASITMTMDVYGHLFPAGKEELARVNLAVEGVLAAANDNFDQKDDTG